MLLTVVLVHKPDTSTMQLLWLLMQGRSVSVYRRLLGGRRLMLIMGTILDAFILSGGTVLKTLLLGTLKKCRARFAMLLPVNTLGGGLWLAVGLRMSGSLVVDCVLAGVQGTPVRLRAAGSLLSGKDVQLLQQHMKDRLAQFWPLKAAPKRYVSLARKPQ